MTLPKMSEQQHNFYLLCGIPRNNEWKVFLELMLDKIATMTAMANEIVSKLVEKEAAIKREKGRSPAALLFPQKGGKDGRGSKVGKCPMRDKRDNKGHNNRKGKNLPKCFHCLQRGHVTITA